MGEEPTSTAEMVAEARREVRGLSIEEFERVRQSGEALIIDVRDVRERWNSGTVPGARHAPRGMLEFWADPDSEYHKDYFDRQTPVVLYCAGGLRSALAAQTLQRLGYTDVSDLEVGYEQWKEAGGAWEEVPVPDSVRR